MSAASEPPIVDTHTHLDEPAFDPDRDDVIASARAVGVCEFINIGYSPERWESSRRLGERHPDVQFSIGHHPVLASEFGPEVARALQAAARALGAVAIGETGLDFSRPVPTVREQIDSFRAQLEIAASDRLPVIVHQRQAAEALIAELDRWPDLAPIVLHSFEGTSRLAEWAIERGCHIGIGGLATKRSSDDLRAVLGTMPTDRLLLETDSPYLPPPGTASRRNTPGNLPRIAEILAPLWTLTREDLCRITSTNARALFGQLSTESVVQSSEDARGG